MNYDVVVVATVSLLVYVLIFYGLVRGKFTYHDLYGLMASSRYGLNEPV